MSISGCIIARNEEETLERCLSSVSGLVDEIVFVDTGSEDKTIEIASVFTDRIFRLAWADDFSFARNYALDLARGEWIVFLDADESIQVDRIWLKDYLDHKKHTEDALLCAFYDLEHEFNRNLIERSVTRIFRNLPCIRYHRTIHEYLAKDGGKLILSDCRREIKIFHSGYTLEAMYAKNKYQRNLTMLLNELKKNPTDSELNFYLADTYRIGGEWLKSAFHINIALQNGNFRTQDCQRMSHILKIIIMMESRLSQNYIILETIKEYLTLYPGNPELLACLGLILTQLGCINESKKLLVTSEELNRKNPDFVNLSYLVLPKVNKILYGREDD